MNEIGLCRISLSGWNPRKNFEPEALEELKKSIREHGILEPLIVRAKPGNPEEGYELVAGERRFRAAQELGFEMVPVVIKELSDRDVREIMLIENLQRSGLEPLEEAEALNALLQEDEITQEDLGKKLGKSQSWIANRLRLLKAPDELKGMIISRKISPKHAMALLPYVEYPVFNEVIMPDLNGDIEKDVPISVARLEHDIEFNIRHRSDKQVLPLHDFPYDVERYRDFFDFSKCDKCKDVYTPPAEVEVPEECNTEKDEKGVCSHLWGETCGVTCCRACSEEDCNSRCEVSAEEKEEDGEEHGPERYCLNRRCWSDKLNIAKQKYEKEHAEKVKNTADDDIVDVSKLKYGEYERVGKWSGWDKTECQTCKSNKKKLGEDYKNSAHEFICIDPVCAKRKESEHSKKEARKAKEEAERAFEKLDAYIAGKPTISDSEVRGLIKILVRHLWGESIKKALKPWSSKAGKWNEDEVDKIPDDDVVKALLRLVFVQELTAHNYQGITVKGVEKIIALFEGRELPKEE